MIYIPLDNVEEMARVCAELTKQNIAFVCKRGPSSWEIECTGY